eukprot:2387838-Pyramimonas_sp.AAC.1
MRGPTPASHVRPIIPPTTPRRDPSPPRSPRRSLTHRRLDGWWPAARASTMGLMMMLMMMMMLMLMRLT